MRTRAKISLLLALSVVFIGLTAQQARRGAGSTGDVSTTGTPVDNQLAIFTDEDTIEGDADLTWDDTNLFIKAAVPLLLEGATADAHETSIAVTDPTADRTVTFANATGTVMLTSLAANGADLVNAVTGGSNSLIWEGTADGYETTLTATDPTADRTITIPNVTGTILTTGATVTVAQGGSGATSLTDGGVLLGSGTGAVTATSVLADGEILIGDGSTDPVALDIGSSTSVTIVGTIATGTWEATDVGVAHGGTGASSLTDGGILLGSGTGAITALGVAANGEIPIGDNSTDPQLATLTGTSNEITVTNGSGSITLSIPDASIFVTPRATGASEFNGAVLIGANGTTLDGHVHILAPDTSTAPLVVESPASTGNNNIIMQYDGTAAIQFGVKAADRSLRFAPADLGNDALGPWIDMGRNSNGTSAGGAAIALTDRGNQRYYVWAADDGDLHIGTTAPIGSQDTSGGVVGAQDSPEAIKNILHTNSIEDAGTALAEVVDTPTHRFTYKKEDRHPGIVHVGLAVPDGEMPWYAQSPATHDDYLDNISLVPGTGKHLNEVNLFGYLILSIQALNQRIEDLEE